MKSKYIVIIVLALVAAALVYWYIQRQKASQKPAVYVAPKTNQAATQQPAQSLGAQVYQQQQNPVSGQVPTTNPFKQTANPIDQSYTNPF